MQKHLTELRFLVDANMGKVVPWLRALGFDTAFARAGADTELLRQAEREGRVLLTRDRALAGRRPVRAGRVRVVLVRSEVWRQQLADLAQVLPLLQSAQPFTRCLACNTALRPCPLEEAWLNVPRFVYQTQREFHRCPSCGRTFWRGSHWGQMSAVLDELARVTHSASGVPELYHNPLPPFVLSPEATRRGESLSKDERTGAPTRS